MADNDNDNGDSLGAWIFITVLMLIAFRYFGGLTIW